MDFEELSEDVLSAEINYELLSSHQSEKLMFYGLYALMNQFELHLDKILNKYKYMTLTWLLATYAGIGFFFSAEMNDLQVSKHFVTCIISLFGIIGILSIWYLDVCVFQRLWGSFFIAEVNLEKKHKFLGEISKTALSIDSVKSKLIGGGLFYSISVQILFLTIAVNVLFLTKMILLQAAISIGVIIFGLFVMRAILSVGKKQLHSLETLLK